MHLIYSSQELEIFYVYFRVMATLRCMLTYGARFIDEQEASQKRSPIYSIAYSNLVAGKFFVNLKKTVFAPKNVMQFIYIESYRDVAIASLYHFFSQSCSVPALLMYVMRIAFYRL